MEVTGGLTSLTGERAPRLAHAHANTRRAGPSQQARRVSRTAPVTRPCSTRPEVALSSPFQHGPSGILPAPTHTRPHQRVLEALSTVGGSTLAEAPRRSHCGTVVVDKSPSSRLCPPSVRSPVPGCCLRAHSPARPEAPCRPRKGLLRQKGVRGPQCLPGAGFLRRKMHCPSKVSGLQLKAAAGPGPGSVSACVSCCGSSAVTRTQPPTPASRRPTAAPASSRRSARSLPPPLPPPACCF